MVLAASAATHVVDIHAHFHIVALVETVLRQIVLTKTLPTEEPV
jgi:hypothetical protein